MSNYQVNINAEQTLLIDRIQRYDFAAEALADGATAFFNGRDLWIIPDGSSDPGAPITLDDFAFGGTTRSWTDVQLRALEDGGFVLAGAIHWDTPGRVQVFNADGSARSEAFDLPGPLEEVAAMSSGGFAVTYVDYEGEQPVLRMRGFSANGVAAGTPTTVTNHAEYVDDLGSSLTQLSNGQFVVEWRYQDTARQYRIVNRDGSLASEIMNASDTYGGYVETGELLEHSHILERPEGGFAIFWTDPASNVRGRLFAADGEPEGESFLAASRVGHLNRYSVDVTEDGLFLIVAGSDNPVLHVLEPDGGALLRNYALPDDIDIAGMYGFSEADGMPTLYLSGPTTNPDVTAGETFITLDVTAGYVFGDDNDTFVMREGRRNLDAGAGDDTISGTLGADEISGGMGHDQLTGNLGADWLNGGDGDDVMNGGDGNDTLIGDEGNDTLSGGDSANDVRDVMYGGNGNDNLDGGFGNDELRGDAGDDRIAGGFGADTVIGGAGNDTLTGSAFSDQIFGGDGDDFVNGGWGHDRVNGGAGADLFFHIGIFNHGSDWIQDYNAAEGDVLIFGNTNANRSQFQINAAHRTSADGERAGDDDIAEAFVIYRPTGQIMWALVDGMGQDSINLQIGGDVFDLMA